jgi:hypothetical protein
LNTRCRDGLVVLIGLAVMSTGTTIGEAGGVIIFAYGVRITLIPVIGPIALPHIKKRLKIMNDWRVKNGLRTHREFKKALKEGR